MTVCLPMYGPIQEGGQLDGALVLPPPPPFALTDASSLLWRMDLLAVETGAMRWRGVAEVNLRTMCVTAVNLPRSNATCHSSCQAGDFLLLQRDL